MDSSAAIRSFHGLTGTMSHMQSSLQKPGIIPIHSVGWNSQSRLFTQGLAIGVKHINSHSKWRRTLVSCAKTTGISATKSKASLEGKPLQTAMFPSGFEALILEVCDETQIAELKVKVGESEMHLKRNVGVTKVPLSNISPTTLPPVPTKPMLESGPSIPPPSPPKSSPEKTNPFVNFCIAKSSKLAALEASGNYITVSSPTVGTFRRGRTIKGKRQPPICKEGDYIKEGQVIGYLDQFGTSLPVKSDVAGEVLKLLFQDGEAVGYGDPLIAILPSFQNT
ncbi:accB, partial [Mucuna pruriens]